MKRKLLVLLIDDEKETLQNRAKIIERFDHNCISCSDGEEAIQLIMSRRPDIILTDLKMPTIDGTDILRIAKKVIPDVVVIIFTAYASVDTAVETMKLGAFDYIEKPSTAEQLGFVLERAANFARLSQENKLLRKQVRHTSRLGNIIGSSKVMAELLDTIVRYAKTDANVLIYGESGTGKELIARAIHEHSHRNNKTFVPVDCGALPEQLLESELFGHEKGAFTGATETRHGLLEYADKGTFFFDEVIELSLNLQAKLLRVLQERQLRRLGCNKLIPINIRIISATNRNPDEAVQEKILREDLYYRLNVLPITVPPLRERKEDLPLLVDHFLKKYLESNEGPDKLFSTNAIESLIDYPWPGNVRELQAVVERVLALSKNEIINEREILQQIGNSRFNPEESPSTVLSFQKAKENNTREFEKEYLHKLLVKSRGNIMQASREAGVSRKTIYMIINKHSIDISQYKQ